MLQLSPIRFLGPCFLVACGVPQRLPADLGPRTVDSGSQDMAAPFDFGASDMGDTSPDCGIGEPAGDEGLILGTGRDAFRPICSGDDFVWLAVASNGGGHLEGGLRIEDSVLEDLSTEERNAISYEFRVVDFVTAGRVTDPEVGQRLQPAPGGSLEAYNVILFVDGQGPESAYELLFRPGEFEDVELGRFNGRRFVYQAFVDLPDGRRLTRTATVTSRCCQDV
ncbi:MAG: hypothetical protein AAGD10_05975 [Myxococcota bacterium]